MIVLTLTQLGVAFGSLRIIISTMFKVLWHIITFVMLVLIIHVVSITMLFSM